MSAAIIHMFCRSRIKDGTVSDSETATESDEEYDENSDAFTDSDDTEDPEA